MQRLSVRLNAATARLVTEGHLWIHPRDLPMTSELELAEPGSLLELYDAKGKPLGLASFNPHSTIPVRILSRNPQERIDTTWFHHKLSEALAKREAWFDVPYYRLVHSEGDGLPGLIIDRFGERVVVQASTAGMEQLQASWLEALQLLLSPRSIILRGDTPSRAREGLVQKTEAIGEPLEAPVEVWEHSTYFLADLMTGQKTGWFYDHRENRRRMADHCAGKTALDLYSHSGGFGLPAARAGATQVTLVDASAKALTLANQAAQRNSVASRCETIEEDVFTLLSRWVSQKRRFDVVMADPPAFIKERRHKANGLKGYEKLAQLCVSVTQAQGLFFIASCSHHADPASFKRAVETGIRKAGREVKLIGKGEADRDHPVHPKLPENRYLKALLYQLQD
jgi:23S rRNA (cytosine1962-C5)-methyltransferase